MLNPKLRRPRQPEFPYSSGSHTCEMIIVRNHRVAALSKVSVSELDEFLRLRDASVLHVVPRSVGDVQDESQQVEVGDDSMSIVVSMQLMWFHELQLADLHQYVCSGWLTPMP